MNEVEGSRAWIARFVPIKLIRSQTTKNFGLDDTTIFVVDLDHDVSSIALFGG